MLLLSIHPKYVDAIIAGTKTVELRRRKPRVRRGPAIIYATSPRMELAAAFEIQAVRQGPLNLLWQAVRDSARVSRREFDRYFAGLDAGVAIEIRNVTPLTRPIPLCDLKRIWDGFHPPQEFYYLTADQIANLWLDSLKAAA